MSFVFRQQELDLRIRPERGLDIGAASLAGVPFAWLTPVGEVPGLPGDWDRSWGGGLIHDWAHSYNPLIAFSLVSVLLGMIPFLVVPALRR